MRRTALFICLTSLMLNAFAAPESQAMVPSPDKMAPLPRLTIKQLQKTQHMSPALLIATQPPSSTDKKTISGKSKKEKATAQTDNTDALFNLITSHQQSGQPTSSASSTSDDDATADLLASSTPAEAPDPLAWWNKPMYKANDFLDRNFAKPVSRIYTKIMPKPLNRMVNNFFDNIDTVPTVTNDILQANFYQATSDSWHLLINSTVGIGGAFDVATDVGLRDNYEDFGLTLAQWGWNKSSYFVIPILGPSTVRDGLGKMVNYEMSIYPRISNVDYRNALYVYGLLNDRAQLLQYQGIMSAAAIDPYVFVRDAYLQRRQYLIKRNKELNNPYTAKDMHKYYDPDYLYH